MTAEENLDGRPRKDRLRRLERVFDASPIYFVTACTDNRRSILAAREVHQALLRFAERGEDNGAYLGAYAIMPDHFHLFVAFERETMLSLWVKSLKNSLSKALRSLNIPAPHWQKGFFDHVLRSSESYAQKWEYVRENPVRAGLVQSWEDWAYSGEICRLEYRE
jgi:REP-associated tyrosine transposase